MAISSLPPESVAHFFVDDGQEDLDSRLVFHIVAGVPGAAFLKFAPMLERMERKERANGDVTAFYQSFPCALHTYAMPNGGGVEVDPWQRDFACIVGKGKGALPEDAMDVKKVNSGAAFYLKQGRFSTFDPDPHLKHAYCGIKHRMGDKTQRPALGVDKFQLRLLDGKEIEGSFQLYHVRVGKYSSHSVKGGSAEISGSGGGGGVGGSAGGGQGPGGSGGSSTGSKRGREDTEKRGLEPLLRA